MVMLASLLSNRLELEGTRSWYGIRLYTYSLRAFGWCQGITGLQWLIEGALKLEHRSDADSIISPSKNVINFYHQLVVPSLHVHFPANKKLLYALRQGYL